MIFDRTGKFIRKIGGIGQGPGEYTRVYDFTIDPENKVIFLNCDLVVNKYKIDGTFLGAIKTGGHSTQIQFCNGKLYLDGLGGYLIRELDPETGKQTFQYLDVKQYNKGYLEPHFKFGGGPFKYRSTESPKLVHTFMDTIMAIQPYGIIPFLAITSHNLTTNADIADSKELIKNERIESIQNRNKIFCINFYFETKNHIGFSYIHGKNLISILYDRQNKTYKKGNFRNDLVFDGKQKMQNIKFSDANGVYESFHESVFLDLIYEQIRNGGLSLNLDKREEIMKLPEDTNPVIFYYSY